MRNHKVLHLLVLLSWEKLDESADVRLGRLFHQREVGGQSLVPWRGAVHEGLEKELLGLGPKEQAVTPLPQ